MATWGVSHDYYLQNERDFWYMLEMSRYLERNDPVVPQGVDRFVANIVQSGFSIKPDTGVDWLDRWHTERFEAFADPNNRQNVDYCMEHSFRDIERLAVRRMVFDGDCAINPMADGRVQALEAHNIRTPIFGQGRKRHRNNRIFLGVEKNNAQQVVRYWTTPDESVLRTQRQPSVAAINAWDYDPITMRNEPNFIHLMNGKRFKQSRGLTALHAILNYAGMFGDVQFATLVKQQMASFIGLTHFIPTTAADGNYARPDYGTTICPYTGKVVPRGPELAPGAEFWPTYAGEEIRPFQANIPSNEFFEHSRLLLTMISLSLGMPLILFTLDATETNFSAWRGALDQAKLQFCLFQNQLSASLHAPLWRWKCRRFLRQDREFSRAYEIIGEDAMRVTWQCPGWPYIEPLKDAQADATEIGANLNSPRRVAARRQLNYDKIIEETVADRAKLIALALDAAEEVNRHPYILSHPDERVTWREISHPVMPDGLQMQVLDKNAQSSGERTEVPKGNPDRKQWYAGAAA